VVNLVRLLRGGGCVSLAEPVARHTQRLYALVNLAEVSAALAAKVREAEEAIYTDPADPLVNWSEDDLRAAFLVANLTEVTVEGVETVAEARISPAQLDRWFSPAAAGERPSYVQRLASLLKPDEIAVVEALYRRKLTGAAVQWRSVTAYVVARRA
jgi:putative ATPase